MNQFSKIRNTLSFRLIFWVGLILLISIFIWAYFNINIQRNRAISGILAEADRLGNTIKMGAHYAMMLNARDDLTQIIKNIGRQEEIENVRIYNKLGQIAFSNRTKELGQITNIKAEACHICHKTDPPTESLNIHGRKRMIDSTTGQRFLGIISPIYNEPGCSAGSCHVHPEDKKVLGLLDVVISLKETDREIRSYQRGIIGLAALIFVGASAIIGLFLLRFVNRPIRKLIDGTRHIGNGEYDYAVQIDRDDEMGHLARAINKMGKEISEKQEELNKKKEDYRTIFEYAPCYITVQDRNYKLIRYNQEFAESFDPEPGDFCYQAYKGRNERCKICPVSKTFEDGQSHYSEEAGINKDGTQSFWVVRTAPIKDEGGKVVAAMELCLDITDMKRLEREVQESEKKYHTIFNNIPNPVFVLDVKSLDIIDCNDSVVDTYGFSRNSLVFSSFLDLFEEKERDRYAEELRARNFINQVRQKRLDGETIYVNIRVSPSEYLGRQVLLVTTSDITKRLMTEQQLIQASKMATLGEMATGVAHELNQPLSVIKTAGSFIKRKVNKGEAIKENILKTMAEEIDGHVDRASKIISHMREFGRKSEVKKEPVQVNAALHRAYDIFSQQLKLREIEVVWDLGNDLPPILADANRLEQVFINLLINARDAIEEHCKQNGQRGKNEKIFLKTSSQNGMVVVEVKDTGGGIPRSVLDKIFEPFFTTKEVGKGTGLGLSISYGIVQDYNGTIKAETEEGVGSSFIIRFPVMRDN